MEIDLEKLVNLSKDYIDKYFDKKESILNDRLAQMGNLSDTQKFQEQNSLIRRREHIRLYNTFKLVNFLEKSLILNFLTLKSNQEIWDKLETGCVDYVVEPYEKETHCLESKLAQKGLSVSSVGDEERFELDKKYDEKVNDVFWTFIKFRSAEFSETEKP
jgi:hypothetical protein